MQLLPPKSFFIPLIFLSFIGCNYKADTKSLNNANRNILPIVFIQPLGNFNDSVLKMLKIGLENALPIKVSLNATISLPMNAWYAPKHRYWADSILIFLKPLHTTKNTYTLGITEEDISTKKDLQSNWGVMGLGFQPGSCCVVSTYRLYKFPQTQIQLLNKLVKVSLHELGHNVGLAHCANAHCIMTDAKGKDILANEIGFCAQCAKKLAIKRLQPKKMLLF